MAEVLVLTLRRDSLDGAELTAPAVPRAPPHWRLDYDTVTPHFGVQMLSPVAWRRAR